MNMQSIVDYGLVLLFFIAIAVLVPFVLAQPEAQHDETEIKTDKKAPPAKTSRLAYGLTAVLFALFIAMTFIAQKGRKH
jgi:archaellum biogenesis protein FlaJ (TadC family)